MTENKLTFLQIGLGSMGKRRIRNLRANGEKNIIGFDFSAGRRDEAEKEYKIKTIDSLDKIFTDDFDAVIISTPPNQHGDYIRFALKHKKHFFVEVTTSDDGYKDIFGSTDLDIVMAPSCTFRYFLPIKMIKEILDQNKIGKVLAFQYHSGQYLPDWHPWEDYRKVYFSKKDTGACREILPFDLIWLNWLVDSDIDEIKGYIAKVSDLDMDADDIVVSSVRYKNNILGGIIIDAISRKPFRSLRIFGEKGVLEWEWLDHIIKVRTEKPSTSKKENSILEYEYNDEVIEIPKGNPKTGYLAAEEMYNDEIKAFSDAINGVADYPYSFEEDIKNLNILYNLESKNG